jgi:hypothetical protein
MALGPSIVFTPGWGGREKICAWKSLLNVGGLRLCVEQFMPKPHREREAHTELQEAITDRDYDEPEKPYDEEPTQESVE